ncbi:MAG: sulfurtransferase [Bacteroidales bacterium]|nr:sulfurtransferase [Bacteroidales bacterium]
MKHVKSVTLLLISLLLVQISFAQKLITAKELKTSKDVIIVDARKVADYTKIHIKNAVNIPKAQYQNDIGLLKPVNAVASVLGNAGITSNSKIVVYCKSGTNAGRLFWVLTYLGAKNVYILDGQLSAWMAVRGPLTKVKPTVKKASFTPAVNSSILAKKSYVKSKLNSSTTILVDARKADDYAEGHIGKAVNIPKEKLMNENHTFKDKATLSALFKSAGVTPDKEVIVYCKTGSRAGAMFFVLTEILKYPKVKVYDGSWNEWSVSL